MGNARRSVRPAARACTRACPAGNTRADRAGKGTGLIDEEWAGLSRRVRGHPHRCALPSRRPLHRTDPPRCSATHPCMSAQEMRAQRGPWRRFTSAHSGAVRGWILFLDRSLAYCTMCSSRRPLQCHACVCSVVQRARTSWAKPCAPWRTAACAPVRAAPIEQLAALEGQPPSESPRS